MQRPFQRFMVPLYTQDTATRIRQTVQKAGDKLFRLVIPGLWTKIASVCSLKMTRKKRPDVPRKSLPTIKYFVHADPPLHRIDKISGIDSFPTNFLRVYTVLIRKLRI